MKKMYRVLKTLFAGLFALGVGVTPVTGGGDFAPSEPVEPGDPDTFVQIAADDTGVDTWNPCKLSGGYRYGPSMILNADGSVDVWSASNGPGDIVDVGDGCTQTHRGNARLEMDV